MEGWGSFILKDKFKRLKEDLKVWNKEVFGPLDRRIEKRRKEILKLDTLDEVFSLEDHEIMSRNEQRAYLHRDLNLQAGISSNRRLISIG